MSLRRTAVASSIVLGSLLCSSWAAADLPPPNGQKFVPFYAEVSGLDADRVLLVHPWSMSNGAPTEEVGVLTPGEKLGFGRRIMGEPKIYAMKKADWEALERPLTKLPPEGAVDCGTTVSPTFLVASDGPDEMLVSYRVVELSDSVCKLASGEGDASPSDVPADPAPVADAPSDVAPATPAAADTPAASDTPASGGGCAACAIGERGGGRRSSSTPWWLIGLAALAWRRAKRSTRGNAAEG